MAQFIFEGSGLDEEMEYNSYYEFNPDNKPIFEEIVFLLSQRKNGDKEIIMDKIIHLCNLSMESINA